ncbi:hypothetical protein PybrP1_000881 [[Pythium] brassicae (nom. inval.)]|nr:hypothetical protein PybrP1_000881 [[Pythium] brassicae (nom. inval.)]
MREELKNCILHECDHYALRTDVWTDRAQRSFMAITMNYLDPEFKFRNWALEVEPFPGMLTADAIAAAVQSALQSLLLRNGASNAVSAANKLDIEHMSCVAHSLHLVVAGAMIKRNRAPLQPEVELAVVKEIDELDDEPDQEDAVCEAVEAFVVESAVESDRVSLSKMQAIVAVFRALATFFRKSPKVQDDQQQEASGATPRTPARPSWNSKRGVEPEHDDRSVECRRNPVGSK